MGFMLRFQKRRNGLSCLNDNFTIDAYVNENVSSRYFAERNFSQNYPKLFCLAYLRVSPPSHHQKIVFWGLSTEQLTVLRRVTRHFDCI